jgi:hypothetical protein
MQMAVSPAQVYAKAKAYVEALCKLPRSQYAAVPSGHYGRDYNTLRKFALEAIPEIDERLLGRYLSVRPLGGGREVCDAKFVEIETYARQIMEQLATIVGQEAGPAPGTVPQAPPAGGREKAYDVQARKLTPAVISLKRD